jgi:hypothetical protein
MGPQVYHSELNTQFLPIRYHSESQTHTWPGRGLIDILRSRTNLQQAPESTHGRPKHSASEVTSLLSDK